MDRYGPCEREENRHHLQVAVSKAQYPNNLKQTATVTLASLHRAWRASEAADPSVLCEEFGLLGDQGMAIDLCIT